MNLYSKRLDVAFLLALLPTLFMPALFPGLRFFFFVPFLIILFYQKKLVVCLWASLLAGLLLDLLSSHSRLGIYAFAYVCTTLVLYRYKRHFFADSLSTLPLMTFFFSALTSFMQLLLIYTFEKKIQLGFEWWITDLIVYPIGDAVYGFCIYIVPGWVFGKPIRKGRDYFVERNLELGRKDST